MGGKWKEGKKWGLERWLNGYKHFAAAPADMSSVPKTHIWELTVTTVLGDQAFSDSCRHYAHAYVQTSTPIKKINKSLKSKRIKMLVISKKAF